MNLVFNVFIYFDILLKFMVSANNKVTPPWIYSFHIQKMKFPRVKRLNNLNIFTFPFPLTFTTLHLLNIWRTTIRERPLSQQFIIHIN